MKPLYNIYESLLDDDVIEQSDITVRTHHFLKSYCTNTRLPEFEVLPDGKVDILNDLILSSGAKNWDININVVKGYFKFFNKFEIDSDLLPEYVGALILNTSKLIKNHTFVISPLLKQNMIRSGTVEIYGNIKNVTVRWIENQKYQNKTLVVEKNTLLDNTFINPPQTIYCYFDDDLHKLILFARKLNTYKNKYDDIIEIRSANGLSDYMIVKKDEEFVVTDAN